ERGHAERDEDGAEPVGAAAGRLRSPLRDEAAPEEHDRKPDRDVDHEDRAPAESLGQKAAEQRPRGGADRAHRTPEPERPVARRALVERGGDDRQRGRRDQRPADPLGGAAREQQARRGRERAEERGAGEERGAREEDAAAPEEVRGPAAEQKKAGEGERVGVED